MSFFEPDLKIEVTLAIFHMSGKIPISNEELNMAASGLHKIPAASLTSFTETLSYPADLEHFNSLISFSVSPLGEINSEKHEDTRQENKKSKVNNRNTNNDPETKRNYSKGDKNGRRTTNVNSSGKRGAKNMETKETDTRKVFIIGDSQLRKINGETLSRDHHSVNVNAMPGAKIAKMKNVNIEDDANVVSVHAGTCNIRKQTNPEKLAEEIVSTLRDVKAKLPKAQVAFSSILKRNDDLELNVALEQDNQRNLEILRMNL